MLRRNIRQELPFLTDLFLLTDKIYPQKYSVLTHNILVRQTQEICRPGRVDNQIDIVHTKRVKVDHANGK